MSKHNSLENHVMLSLDVHANTKCDTKHVGNARRSTIITDRLQFKEKILTRKLLSLSAFNSASKAFKVLVKPRNNKYSFNMSSITCTAAAIPSIYITSTFVRIVLEHAEMGNQSRKFPVIPNDLEMNSDCCKT